MVVTVNRQWRTVWPSTGRITLASLAVVPAVMAYPWRSARDQWVLGVAAAVVVVVFGWWRGLHLTQIVRRRLAMTRRRRRPQPRASIDVKATALIRVRRLNAEAPGLPLLLIARYLNRYGIRADKVRITVHHAATGVQQTWIGLTVSAADNLAALQARCARIPLQQATLVAARRLASQLRELGWAACIAGPDDVPPLAARSARETWRAVVREIAPATADYVAAYRIDVDTMLADTLEAIWTHPASETWAALEIAGDASSPTLAAACAFRAGAKPGSAPPLAGLVAQHGNHRAALTALNPLSTQRLDGHTRLTGHLLGRLNWPTTIYPMGAKRSAGEPLRTARMPTSGSGFDRLPALPRTSACRSASTRSARHSPIPWLGATS